MVIMVKRIVGICLVSSGAILCLPERENDFVCVSSVESSRICGSGCAKADTDHKACTTNCGFNKTAFRLVADPTGNHPEPAIACADNQNCTALMVLKQSSCNGS